MLGKQDMDVIHSLLHLIASLPLGLATVLPLVIFSGSRGSGRYRRWNVWHCGIEIRKFGLKEQVHIRADQNGTYRGSH